jgi:APA family basic amino acid/polyamine antiporter
MTDPWTPRPFRVPGNVRVSTKVGQAVYLPIVGILGFLGITSIIFMVVLTHAIGRIAGPAWILGGLLLYFLYRARTGRPLLGSTPRDWEAEQRAVYHDAGELEILEEFDENVERRDRRIGAASATNGAGGSL